MDTFLVNAGGLVLIAAIVWWFWLGESDSTASDEHQHH